MSQGIEACLKEAVEAVAPRLNPNKRKNCFELTGCDFMLTEDFQLKLIEVNSNPCLEFSCPHLEELLPRVMDDAFQLSVDTFFKPPSASGGASGGSGGGGSVTKATALALDRLRDAKARNRFQQVYGPALPGGEERRGGKKAAAIAAIPVGAGRRRSREEGGRVGSFERSSSGSSRPPPLPPSGAARNGSLRNSAPSTAAATVAAAAREGGKPNRSRHVKAMTRGGGSEGSEPNRRSMTWSTDEEDNSEYLDARDGFSGVTIGCADDPAAATAFDLNDGEIDFDDI
jgi:hypothetical protein